MIALRSIRLQGRALARALRSRRIARREHDVQRPEQPGDQGLEHPIVIIYDSGFAGGPGTWGVEKSAGPERVLRGTSPLSSPAPCRGPTYRCLGAGTSPSLSVRNCLDRMSLSLTPQIRGCCLTAQVRMEFWHPTAWPFGGRWLRRPEGIVFRFRQIQPGGQISRKGASSTRPGPAWSVAAVEHERGWLPPNGRDLPSSPTFWEQRGHRYREAAIALPETVPP